MITSKIVILKTHRGQRYADFIAKEINLAGVWCGIVSINGLKTFLKTNKCIPQETVIHARTAHPDYTYRVLKNLEQQGYQVINSSETLRLTSDKYNLCLFADDHHIKCAQTIKTDKNDIVQMIKEQLGVWHSLIVKPRVSQGQGKFCYKVERLDTDKIEQINQMPGQTVVIQEFIDYSRLSRVIVIGDEILNQAVFYDTPEQDWKCSVCLNPGLKYDENPDPELLLFAEVAAHKFKAEICFVDIFSTQNGYVLNEINTACSLIIHEQISKYNISKKIADYLLTRCKRL